MLAKWGSLVPYAPAAALLKDVLPVDEGLNHETVRRTVHRVGQRIEQEFEDRKFTDDDWFHRRSDRIALFLDAAYLKSWHRPGDQLQFEVVVGGIHATHGGRRCFGFVASENRSEHLRPLVELIQHGYRMRDTVWWVTDGEAALAQYVPSTWFCWTELVLDWFHIAMRFRVLDQLAKGLAKHDFKAALDLLLSLHMLKWNLWNGKNARRRGWRVDNVECEVMALEDPEEGEPYSEVGRIRAAWDDLDNYLVNNERGLVNYGRNRRTGRPISTAPVEGLVGRLVKKRMAKRQQMAWSPAGAHNLLQVRARVLDERLRGDFQRWYPGLAAEAA